MHINMYTISTIQSFRIHRLNNGYQYILKLLTKKATAHLQSTFIKNKAQKI